MNFTDCTLATPLSRRFLLAASMALLAASPAFADAVRYYGAGKVPSPLVVAGILGDKRATPPIKMRGSDVEAAVLDDGRVVDDAAPDEHKISASANAAVSAWKARFEPVAAKIRPMPPALVAPASVASKRVDALAVAVNFDNDSAELQAAALPALDAIAEGMRMVGFARRFVIEGHTSAIGGSAYNRKLSKRRAESVKRYLVQQHRIPASALRAVGKGSSAPLDKLDPNAAANRRVQFRAA